MAGIEGNYQDGAPTSNSSSSSEDFPLHLYKKVGVLGSGGQGDVEEYRLIDGKKISNDTPERVAVKTFRRSSKLWDDSRPQSAGHALLMSLHHESLVRVFGILEKDNKTVVVMELANGSLENLLAERKLNMTEAACIIVQILDGLMFLHKKKIMHRDLKPANILLMAKNDQCDWQSIDIHGIRVMIADYDFVRRFSSESPGETASKSIVGTLRYMAPEIRGEYNVSSSAHYTESADVYAFGVMCWEIFKGLGIKTPDVPSDFITMLKNDPELVGTSLLNFILLQVHPNKRKRKSASKLLKHPFLGVFGQLLLERQKSAKEFEVLRRNNALLSKEKEQLQVDINAAKEKIATQNDVLEGAKKENDDLKRKFEVASEQASSYHDTLNQVLWSASFNGELNSTREALIGGAKVDWTDSIHGSTPLKVASQEGHYDIISILLNYGADINAQNKHGITGLITAAANGHYKCVELLIDKGADLEVRTENSLTALLSAANYGKAECLKLLLDRGADVNVQDSNGNTALILALYTDNDYTECAEMLIKIGADVSLKNNKGRTAFNYAIHFGKLKSVPLLLNNGTGITTTDPAKNKNAALISAAGHGKVESIAALLNSGIDVNFKSADGVTGLMVATVMGNMECMKLLLDHGANINAKSAHGCTALMLTSQNDNHLDCASVLLNSGADVNATSNHNSSALTMAAEYTNEPSSVSLLLTSGAELEHKDNNGNTVLMCAVLGGKLKIVKTLVEVWKADLTTKRNNGQSLLAAAEERKRDDVADYLKEKGVEP